MSGKKLISVMVPTYNEEENVIPLSEAIIEQFEKNLTAYNYEIIFIDNCSKDSTRAKLEQLCGENPRIKAIFNARNFGQFNSPFHGLRQTNGDCTIAMCADFQDPVEMLPKLVAEWEKGHKIVCAIKSKSKENKLMRFFRSFYYKLIKSMSDVEQIEHFTGFGLYDKAFINVLRDIDDPSPFLRGIVAELGFKKIEIPYEQQKRRAGKTSNNFGRLYDGAMLSFTSYTKTPIRLITFLGVLLFALSCIGGILCIIFHFTGLVPLMYAPIFAVIGIFGSLNFIFIGIVGEYLLNIKTKVTKRPLVVEEKRINFDEMQGGLQNDENPQNNNGMQD